MHNQHALRTWHRPLLLCAAVFVVLAFGVRSADAGNIDSQYRWAWNDTIGWIDFGYTPGNVAVGPTSLSGYASSGAGIIDLNCADFSLCGASNYLVTRTASSTGGVLAGWAWNDAIGWVSFNCQDLGVCGTSNYYAWVGSDGYLHGWAWNDRVGWIGMNCNDAGTCFYNNYPNAWNAAFGWMNVSTVTLSTTSLAGLASTSIGAVSFNCQDYSWCGTSNYYVARSIQQSGGSILSGWAWNDNVGWIWFWCMSAQYGECNYMVKTLGTFYALTGALDSATYDTGIASGVSYNSIMWEGSLPLGTAVKFQLATASSTSGPWNFVGPDGTGSTWYQPLNPDQPAVVSNIYHFGQRYFRYRVQLNASGDASQTPTVNKVIINYSP